MKSYPKIYAHGNRAIAELFLDAVLVEEKVDGSQCSFGKDQFDKPGLFFWSHHKELDLDAPDKMFNKGVEYVKSVEDQLIPRHIYRGEFLQKPKHNTLAYDRVPENNIVIFDIEDGFDGNFLGPREKKALAKKIGLECVPMIAHRAYSSWEELKELLDRESFLGGQKVEGIVIKNYDRLSVLTGDTLMGKYVSEAFKEIHQSDWKERNPGAKDIIGQIIEKFRTPARWQKAIQHLRDRGELTDSPKDIGALLKETNQDVLAECREEILDILWKWAWKDIGRGVTKGLPEYYKERLAEEAFE